MSTFQISIIIPAFNAVNSIELTISKIRNIFGNNVEIIVVINDPDECLIQIVKKISKTDNNIKIINFRKRLGKGKAIIEGLKVARGKLIGFMDADTPFNINTIKKKIALLSEDKYDCLIFSKWKNSSFFQIKQKTLRKLLSRIFNLFTRSFLHLNFKDTQGGCKFLKNETMQCIGYDFLSQGFAFDAELLLKLKQKKLTVLEVPVEYCHNEESTVNIFRDTLPVICDLFKLHSKYCKNSKAPRQP